MVTLKALLPDERLGIWNLYTWRPPSDRLRLFCAGKGRKGSGRARLG
jgi:hypothetical protein